MTAVYVLAALVVVLAVALVAAIRAAVHAERARQSALADLASTQRVLDDVQRAASHRQHGAVTGTLTRRSVDPELARFLGVLPGVDGCVE